jgi:hypothetical protein
VRMGIYERLALDRKRAEEAVRKEEERQRELAQLRWEHASVRFDLAILKFRRALGLKYDSNQPRVPAGQPGGGQWTSGNDGETIGSVSRARRLAEVIRVCTISGVSRTVTDYGVKTHRVTYECPVGQTIVREGFGHSPPGLIRDPFR